MDEVTRQLGTWTRLKHKGSRIGHTAKTRVEDAVVIEKDQDRGHLGLIQV